MAKMYYEKDCDLSYLKGKKIAIIGYGSQGHAHALNLKDSGCDVCVGLREGSKNWANAEAAGLAVKTVPAAAQFFDEGKGKYTLRAADEKEDGVFYDGALECRIAKGGALYEVNSTMTAVTLHGDAPVISEREAYDRLRAGRFDSRNTYSFSQLASAEVHVVACDLEYLTDSKGYRQPVYYFTLSDDQDGELRGGRPWQVFVPALA